MSTWKDKYHLEDADIQREWEEIKAAQEDTSKFEVLYNRYHERIFRFVYQRIEEMQLSADITSQVFYKAMIHLKDYRFKGTPFSAWLFRIATNELNQEFRRNTANRSINIDSVADIKALVQDTGDQYSEEKIGKLLNAMDDLSDEDVDLLDMRYFEKRSFKEISHILAISENNAKVKIHRLLKRLNKLITDNKESDYDIT